MISTQSQEAEPATKGRKRSHVISSCISLVGERYDVGIRAHSGSVAGFDAGAAAVGARALPVPPLTRVDDEDGPARPRQLQRRGQARMATAYDDDVDMFGPPRSLLLRGGGARVCQDIRHRQPLESLHQDCLGLRQRLGERAVHRPLEEAPRALLSMSDVERR